MTWILIVYWFVNEHMSVINDSWLHCRDLGVGNVFRLETREMILLFVVNKSYQKLIIFTINISFLSYTRLISYISLRLLPFVLYIYLFWQLSVSCINLFTFFINNYVHVVSWVNQGKKMKATSLSKYNDHRCVEEWECNDCNATCCVIFLLWFFMNGC